MLGWLRNAGGMVAGMFRSTPGAPVSEAWPDTSWHRFMTAVGRLPRPMLMLAIVGMFAHSYADTPRFVEVMQAWSHIPGGVWTVVSLAVGFWFASRPSGGSITTTSRIDPGVGPLVGGAEY